MLGDPTCRQVFVLDQSSRRGRLDLMLAFSAPHIQPGFLARLNVTNELPDDTMAYLANAFVFNHGVLYKPSKAETITD
jgi:hypothetical protein